MMLSCGRALLPFDAVGGRSTDDCAPHTHSRQLTAYGDCCDACATSQMGDEGEAPAAIRAAVLEHS
jgi:hypothetical protein